jgi:hypothetical protein
MANENQPCTKGIICQDQLEFIPLRMAKCTGKK